MKDGGSAFPKQPMIHTPNVGDTVMEQGGMSLRDYFAAAALTGILSVAKLDGPDKDRIAARVAFKMADAMLAEREKP